MKWKILWPWPSGYGCGDGTEKNLTNIYHYAIIQPKPLKGLEKEVLKTYMDRVKRIWYLSPMRVAKVQASLRIRAVSPEPSLLAHTSSESRGTLRQKARSLAPLNGWTCAVKICHDGMLEDTNSLDGAHMCNVFHHWHCCRHWWYNSRSHLPVIPYYVKVS